MSQVLYILDGDGNAVRCDDMRTWGAWRSVHSNTVVARTVIDENCAVSTIFLCYGDECEAVWETMIRGGVFDGESDQHNSRDEALTGHELWVLVAQGKTTPEAVREMEGALS